MLRGEALKREILVVKARHQSACAIENESKFDYKKIVIELLI